MSILRDMLLALFLLALLPLASYGAPAKGCVAGAVEVGSFQVMVQSGAGAAKPVAQLNTIKQGYKISYKPINLPADIKKEARVALVLAPADGEPTGTTPLTLLELYPANAPAEWTIPARVGVLSLIFGPQGLDEKKVANIVSRDEDLITQLADYADQTAQLESTIQTLVTLDENPEQSDEEVASRLGDTPVEQALLALLRAQNPALSTYNPLAAGRRAPPATLMGRATEGFFDNAGGIVPGGGVLPGIKGYLFPDTELRSTFARRTDSGEMTLCGKRRALRSRTRVAYLWAHRVPNTAPPAARIASTAHAMAGERAALPVKPATASAWEALERVRSWELRSAQGGAAIPATIVVSEPARSFTLDLRKTRTAPGAYRLGGKWDWDDYAVEGNLEIHAPPDLSKARLDPASQGRLVVDSGVVSVKLTGADFEFLEKASLGGPKAPPVLFRLPTGRRAGPQDNVTAEIDTDSLRPGSYELTLGQGGGGGEGRIPLRILPPHPKLSAEPLRLNTGEAQQSILLRGADLARIERLESEQADIALGPPGSEQRKATVRLRSGVKPGDKIALRMKVDGVDHPIPVETAWSVAGPRPRLTLVKTSLPDDLGIALKPGELAAGSFAGFLLETANAGDDATLRLGCEGRTNRTSLFLGQRLASATLEMVGPRWYLSADPGSVGGAGCTLAATLETAAGLSDPALLGRVIRLPRIESADLAADRVLLKGQTLETIEKAAWEPSAPQPLQDLPVPAAGQGPAQTLRTPLAAPTQSGAVLNVWLWGEAEPRATKAVLARPAEPKPSEGKPEVKTDAPRAGDVKPAEPKPAEPKPAQP